MSGSGLGGPAVPGAAASRASVSVVMPFAGDAAAAAGAVNALQMLRPAPGDELLLVDNSGGAAAAAAMIVPASAAGVVPRVIAAEGERSPAHARNVGAEHAGCEWILFLDADCRPPADLLDRYFRDAPAADVGALAGEVVPAPGQHTLAARYGTARSFLSQEAHLAHPFRPRAVAANLMVRREAFTQVGGFYEGVRAAEDTDFSWRLQQAGWRLELRAQAAVEHSYRASIRELRRQWRGYAAGRAWLARRYEGFEPEPAVRRAARRGWRRGWRKLRRGGLRRANRGSGASARQTGGAAAARSGRLDRGRFAALDAVLAVEELRGFALSNRPRGTHARATAQVVLVADRFPALGDPLAEFARTLDHPRVEAAARPATVAVELARELEIDYREDDGAAARAVALVKLGIRHPLRCGRDLVRRQRRGPSLRALAPAAIRLERSRGARVHALGGAEAQATARRLAALTGRRLDGV